MPLRRLSRPMVVVCVPTLVALVSVGSITEARAQEPVPSLVASTGALSGSEVSVWGGAFQAGTRLTLEVTLPDGEVESHAVTADTEGNVEVVFTARQAGEYIARARDRERRELAQVAIYVAPRVEEP